MTAGRFAPSLALVVGSAGGVAASAVGMPAPWLTGATIAVTLASVLFLKTDMPRWLRDGAFSVIGLSIGSGVDETILGRIGGWAPSLMAVIASTMTAMAVSSWFLGRFARMDRTTAKLASCPGALGYVIAMALDGRGDLAQVMLVQSTRLFVLTAILPPVLELSGMQPSHSLVYLTLVETAALLVLAFPLGRLWERWRMPASYLLAGMAISAAAHMAGLAHGLAPSGLTNPAYVVTGTLIGLRFGRNGMDVLVRLLPWALGSAVIATVIAAGFAGGVAALTGIPFAAAFVAMAPGGVEAMAAMALALGLEPAFVAAHHLLRIGFLTLIVPWWLGKR